MKNHTKIYFAFFGYDESSYIQCEIPGCGQRAVDICHIDARGMGGRKSADVIENLMAKCRKHHEEYGDKKQHKEMLRKVHLAFMAMHQPSQRFIKKSIYPSLSKVDKEKL